MPSKLVSGLFREFPLFRYINNLEIWDDINNLEIWEDVYEQSNNLLYDNSPHSDWHV